MLSQLKPTVVESSPTTETAKHSTKHSVKTSPNRQELQTTKGNPLWFTPDLDASLGRAFFTCFKMKELMRQPKD